MIARNDQLINNVSIGAQRWPATVRAGA